jgi:hypothetical protein
MDENSSTARDVARRLRRGSLWVLFATTLMLPRVLALRRRPRRWNFLRFAAGLLGAAIVAVDFVNHSGAVLAGCGAALTLLAVLIPAEHNKPSIDEQAREFGALVVVNGGWYRTADGSLVKAQLFVGPDRIRALDADLHTLLEIPLGQLGVVRVEAVEQTWRLCLGREEGVAEFFYRGPFAEHLARVAESTVRSQLHRELPVLR